ncbi:hypothetical protein ILUMI_04399 [Ignelater luminosus]|uniref:CHK kinase-like domain-containing protein n=1 Tax=Ignelater luminosus TaxID=2038154 RepID=A0A8K0GL78_IGNLU|nr:hypothetical protein ILUMI_04399 [Ignelater luminosus]
MDNIEKCLMKIAEKEGIVDVVISNLPEIDGQGYLSNISVMNLQGQRTTGERCKLNLLIKIAATNEKLRQITAVGQLFHSEIRMYDSIFPAFYEFEKQRGIANPFSIVPKCYTTFRNTVPEILIFENLNESGYHNWNRKLQMDSEHVKTVLKEYGKFHAVSFAMRDQNPKQFQQLIKNFDNNIDIMFKKSGIFYAYVTKVKRLLTLLDLQADSSIFRKYQEFINKAEEKFDFLISESDNVHAILHGDCWCNNMLFKYKEPKHLQPSGICFIDFQLTRLASPAFDVVHFFYTCASKEILKDFQIYQRIYYESFSQHLKTLGSNADSLYSFSAFVNHWKKYATFGLFFSSLEHHAMLSEEDEIISFAQVLEKGGTMEEAFDYEIANVNEYKSRMKAIVEHFVDNDLL